jgi:5'(3')-deoxyribonucleotidase
MRVGFDVDGVLADFNGAFISRIERLTGRKLFAAEDEWNPPCWDYPEMRGYTREELRAVWKSIHTDPAFWQQLSPLHGAHTLATYLPRLAEHDLYFITHRSGVAAKAQTERWLYRHLQYHTCRAAIWPTVLLTGDKGATVRALELDVYIDDKLDNAVDCCVRSPTTRTYLLNREYSQGHTTARRVASVMDLIDIERNALGLM